MRAAAGQTAQIHAHVRRHALRHRRRLGRLGQESQHIALDHALAAVAGRRHLRQVDVFLLRQLARARGGKNRARRAPYRPAACGAAGAAALRTRQAVSPSAAGASGHSLKLIRLLADHGHHGQHRHHFAFFVRADVNVALRIGLHGEDGLIGLDFHHFLALADLGAVRHQPFDQGDLFDRLPQFGNKEFFCHQLTTFRQAAMIRPSFGMA